MTITTVSNCWQALTCATSRKTYLGLAVAIVLVWVAKTCVPTLGSRNQPLAKRTSIYQGEPGSLIPEPTIATTLSDRVLFAIGRREQASALAFAGWFHSRNKRFATVEDFDKVCLGAETTLDPEHPPKGWETEQRILLRSMGITIRTDGTLKFQTEGIRQRAMEVLVNLEIIDPDDKDQGPPVPTNAAIDSNCFHAK